MKTLVTGATGFIGRHLVKALIEKGDEVRCLVRRTSNVNGLDQPGVEFVYGDLLDKAAIAKAVQDIDAVYHLGGEVYSLIVKDFHRVNVEGTKNLLDACMSNAIQRFVFFSSIAASGPNRDKKKPLRESDSCNPITPYGVSKLESEKIVLDYFRKYKLPVVIVRPPTVYGPGQSDVLSKFFQRVNKGSFFIFGNGEYLRSLCYIKNLIDGAILAGTKSEAIGEIFFISDKKIYNFKEIVCAIAEVQGHDVALHTLPPFIAHFFLSLFNFLIKFININIMRFYTIGTMGVNLGCEISKAEKVLAYDPKISLKQGLSITNEFLLAQGKLS